MTREEKIAILKDIIDGEIIHPQVRREVGVWAIKELEQNPKTGHWIHFANSDDCSECGWSTGKYISPSKYCPNCGCRMVDEQEGSDKK